MILKYLTICYSKELIQLKGSFLIFHLSFQSLVWYIFLKDSLKQTNYEAMSATIMFTLTAQTTYRTLWPSVDIQYSYTWKLIAILILKWQVCVHRLLIRQWLCSALALGLRSIVLVPYRQCLNNTANSCFLADTIYHQRDEPKRSITLKLDIHSSVVGQNNVLAVFYSTYLEYSAIETASIISSDHVDL